jgi:predicted porin
MADDAESPVQQQVDGDTITATATDSETNEITVDSTDNVYEYNTYVTFSAPTIGGLVAGRKYYIAYTDEGTPGTITLSNEPNGPIVQLTTATGSMTGTTVIYDTVWTGTAGDIQFGCCQGGSGEFQCISATNFIFGEGRNLWDVTSNSDGWIERLTPTSAIMPRWAAILYNNP